MSNPRQYQTVLYNNVFQLRPLSDLLVVHMHFEEVAWRIPIPAFVMGLDLPRPVATAAAIAWAVKTGIPELYVGHYRSSMQACLGRDLAVDRRTAGDPARDLDRAVPVGIECSIGGRRILPGRAPLHNRVGFHLESQGYGLLHQSRAQHSGMVRETVYVLLPRRKRRV